MTTYILNLCVSFYMFGITQEEKMCTLAQTETKKGNIFKLFTHYGV